METQSSFFEKYHKLFSAHKRKKNWKTEKRGKFREEKPKTELKLLVLKLQMRKTQW